MKDIKTLGALKESGYKVKSLKEEMRENLIHKIKQNENPFPEILGYEDSVLPELKRGILSMHNINLLGLRGQGKTKIARLMVQLLDEYIPIIKGSEINDDPFNPISKYAKDIIEEKGDNTEIDWLHRNDRFYEKLATPDVTISDLIGDIDPIKAANLKLSYADERVLHFGMIPRANRCIFVINELPDLQARIQVALFNILEEGDVQIRGFKLRLPLDVQFVFTANPEDYTNRGSIVTPLKDRIGTQILTHYPKNLSIAKSITLQEAKLQQERAVDIKVPEQVRDIIEQVGFEARKSPYVDVKSGVSARMSITAYENIMSTAEMRALENEESETVVRMSDILGAVPALTGKIELVYEGEQEGASFVANELITEAIKTLFTAFFPKIEKLKKDNEPGPYDAVLNWFFNHTDFILLDEESSEDYRNKLLSIDPAVSIVKDFLPHLKADEIAFGVEFLLWGLSAYDQLSKKRKSEGLAFNDTFNSLIRGL